MAGMRVVGARDEVLCRRCNDDANDAPSLLVAVSFVLGLMKNWAFLEIKNIIEK
jgi:hypothetical protein